MSDCIPAPTGYRNRKGYAQVSRYGTKYQAHRWAWIEVHGPIPDDLCVLHRCDNPECINVEHLFLGTRADNNADMTTKGRHGLTGTKGERHPAAKLTEQQVREIRASSEPLAAAARRYGVCISTISGIRLRRSWKHLDEQG